MSHIVIRMRYLFIVCHQLQRYLYQQANRAATCSAVGTNRDTWRGTFCHAHRSREWHKEVNGVAAGSNRDLLKSCINVL